MRYGYGPNQELEHQKLEQTKSALCIGSRFRRKRFRWAAMAAGIIVLATSAFALQGAPSGPGADRAALKTVKISLAASVAAPVAGTVSMQQEKPSGEDFSKYLPLVKELGLLQEKMQREIPFPASRAQSRLLPMLPASTEIYLALPNYGDSLHQAVEIFHRQLEEREVLRDQWQSFPAGAMVEDALDKVYQFSQYLGNEMVVAAEIKPKGGSALIIAEVRKPGLLAFLQGQLKQFGGAANAPLRILNPQQLLTAKARSSASEPVVLVRPDLMVIAFDLAALKSFSNQLGRPGGKLAPTPFGQRLAQSYQSGAGLLFGADLQRIKNLVPLGSKNNEASFQQTGFADVKYFIAEHKEVAGQPSNNGELSFAGPRHGIASWLAAPAPMGGLDFVSSDAGFVSSVVLKNPVQIFDDIKNIAESSRPGGSADLAQAEAQFKIKLKEDFFSKLGGEITLAMDGPSGPAGSPPPWKAVLQIKDPVGMQSTLQQLLVAASSFMKGEKQPTLEQHIHDGQTYYTLQIFNAQKPIEVDYAFLDGYMVLAGSPTLVSDALRVHLTGKSLAKSSEFQTVAPRDHSKEASALLYQNFAHMIGPMLQQTSPELAQLFQGAGIQSTPLASFAYGDENAIRFVGNTQGVGVAAALVGAAIAIPNLMRSRMAANEAGASATVRTVNTAQIAYQSMYPKKGYAPDLATLGPASDGNCGDGGSESHACLLDMSLGCASGTSGEWCVKNGFRYAITGTCKEGLCDDYVIVATPVNTKAGGKNFCASNDAVVRSQTGSPLSSPTTVSECQSWQPL